MSEMTVSEFASLGGRARASKYSREQIAAWGRKGGEKTKRRHGKKHYSRIRGASSGRKSKKTKEI